jgi:phenylacetate-CoA ligase
MKAALAANLLYFPVTRLAGERIRSYLAEYRANDQLSQAALREKQSLALRQIIDHAGRSTGHYRRTIAKRTGEFPSVFPELDGIEPVTKAMLRDSPEAFVSSEAPGRHERKTTSGSTGHPLTVLKNHDALARERAATWRAYGWAGIQVAAPQGLLWGMPHSSSGRLRARLLDFLANRRRLSMFGVNDDDFARFHDQLMSFRPDYLYGYVSALTEFITFLGHTGRKLPPSVRCLVTTSEVLDATSRDLLERSSGLTVFNEYGCGEVGSIAHECEQGQLHVMGDNLVLECLPAADLPGGLGELVVTDLHNIAMPLIRYRLGDFGRISGAPCSCGRPYPVLETIVGRAYDTIIGISGRKYHPESILYVFEDLRKAGKKIPPFQAIQRCDGKLELNFVTDPDNLKEIVVTLSSRISESLDNDLDVEFQRVDSIAREPSGKLRIVKRDLQSFR